MADLPKVPDRLLATAEQAARSLGDRHSLFTACPTCGRLCREGSRTRNTGERQASVRWLGEEPIDFPCLACVQAHEVSPKLVDWLLDVLRLRDEVNRG
jgi:hypothetical protein